MLTFASIVVSSAAPLGGCSSPVDVKSAPDSPVKSCQLAFLCARDCVRCVGDSCEQDESCVARCVSDNDALSPCGGATPASVGVDAAWGCEGGSYHDELFESQFVPGLCARDNISICGCRWSAYECTEDACAVDGLTTSGTTSETTSFDTDTDTGPGTGGTAGTDDTAGTGGTAGTDSTGAETSSSTSATSGEQTTGGS